MNLHSIFHVFIDPVKHSAIVYTRKVWYEEIITAAFIHRDTAQWSLPAHLFQIQVFLFLFFALGITCYFKVFESFGCVLDFTRCVRTSVKPLPIKDDAMVMTNAL